jgi:Mrp family chromosome partitioning ATPase
MTQAEILKSRIIDVERIPDDVSFMSGGGHASNGGPRSSSTAIALREKPMSEALSPFVWSSPVAIVEEVALPAALDVRLVALRAPGSAQARSYRLLRHRLSAQGDPRVIAVTSAGPGEGKTTCAANLALVLSEAPLSRVLLVEASLPRPAFADLFGFEPADSFMIQLLRSEDPSPPYAVASVGGIGLQLAALNPGAVRGKRLDRALLAATIAGLRGTYDYIVIDAASVLESADANSVSQCSDGVVVVARAGKSRRGSLKRAVDQLQPANVIGTVLIDT